MAPKRMGADKPAGQGKRTKKNQDSKTPSPKPAVAGMAPDSAEKVPQPRPAAVAAELASLRVQAVTAAQQRIAEWMSQRGLKGAAPAANATAADCDEAADARAIPADEEAHVPTTPPAKPGITSPAHAAATPTEVAPGTPTLQLPPPTEAMLHPPPALHRTRSEAELTTLSEEPDDDFQGHALPGLETGDVCAEEGRDADDVEATGTDDFPLLSLLCDPRKDDAEKKAGKKRCNGGAEQSSKQHCKRSKKGSKVGSSAGTQEVSKKGSRKHGSKEGSEEESKEGSEEESKEVSKCGSTGWLEPDLSAGAVASLAADATASSPRPMPGATSGSPTTPEGLSRRGTSISLSSPRVPQVIKAVEELDASEALRA